MIYLPKNEMYSSGFIITSKKCKKRVAKSGKVCIIEVKLTNCESAYNKGSVESFIYVQ